MAAVVLAASLGAPRPARAEFAEDAGWGLLTVLGNLVYMPGKTVYSLMGGLTGGLAYVCTGGNFDTASTVWSMSMGGTYVLTPGMLRGETPIAFAGGSSEPEHRQRLHRECAGCSAISELPDRRHLGRLHQHVRAGLELGL